MKFRSRLLAFIICSSFVQSFQSCKKGWIDINYNPRDLTEISATPDLILPSLLLAEASDQANVNFSFNQWMGYWSYPKNPAGSPAQTYNIQDPRDFPTTAMHADVILLEQNAVRNEQPFYTGIAKVLKVLNWSHAVDQFNNLPYSEANNILINKPKYDNGIFIYEDLIKQLDAAISLIKDASLDKAIRLGASDIVFKGNKDKWIRFANTLKLRLLVHQANRPERAAYISAEIAKIQAQGGGFLLSGEDAAVNPGFTEAKPSPFFAMYSAYDILTRYYFTIGAPRWEGASANVTAMNMLKVDSDPRLAFFYSPAASALPANAAEPFAQPAPAEFRGNRYGLPLNFLTYPYQQSQYVSQVGGVKTRSVLVSPTSTGIIKGYNMSCWLMTSIESFFLQAEAIQRGWMPGNAEFAYKEAIKESFRWLNVGGNTSTPQLSDAAFNNWYDAQVVAGNMNVSWSAAPDKYKLLMFQKYMAFNGIEPFETYVDYRRNGAYPAIPLSYDPARIGNTLPVRALYPQAEYIQNKDNVEAQGTIDIFTSKIWWMP